MIFLKLNGVTISSATNDIKMFSFFYKEFNKIVNKHAPMKTLSHRKAKQCSKPWITKGIRTSKLKTSYIYLTMTLKINFIEIKSAVWHKLVKSNIPLNISRPTKIIWKKTWIWINNILNHKTKTNKSICALKDFKNNNKGLPWPDLHT